MNEEHGVIKRPTHDGSRGPDFRAYKRDFFALARGKFSKDDRYSWWSAFNRLDEGGTAANAPAMPAQQGGAGGGNNPAFIAATTKRQIRHGQAFNFLYESQTDDNIKQMLSDLADTLPAELAGDAWDLVVKECDEPSDDLELSRMNLTWTSLTILNTVGHVESTITDYARELNNTNSRRPPASRYTEDDKCLKFLSSIVYPESLAKDAAKELRAIGAKREFKKGANNARDYNAMVSNFDNLWRALFQTGSITSKAAHKGQPYATALTHEDGLIHDVIRGQHACRNCWGMGHNEKVCPSTKQNRPIEEVMEVLLRILRSRNNSEDRSNAMSVESKAATEKEPDKKVATEKEPDKIEAATTTKKTTTFLMEYSDDEVY